MELREKCGIVGIYGKDLPVSRLCFFSLFALQHRGQEASGITTNDSGKLKTKKGAGLVAQVFTEEDINSLTGHIGIGHNRYSTSGGTALDHAQPVLNEDETFALAHNGNLPSVEALKSFLKKNDALKPDRSDSELMADAISFHLSQGKTLADSVKEVFPLLTGAFSLVMMTPTELVAVRDSFGVRPLVLGKLGDGFVVASETCALQTIEAEFVREVNPGEMILVNESGLTSVELGKATPRHDVFEYVYFARPDSVIEGKLVYEVRKNFGRRLAQERKIDADIVVPVPDSAVPVAMGYSEASGIPLEMSLVKNRYVHRTFIEPDQAARRKSVALKLIPLPETLKGKRVALVDDSIVRGTTSQKLIKRIFEAGAKEVHFLISSPPVRFPDFYGIDTPKQNDLIAATKTIEEIREFLGADSLYFLSLEGLIESIGLPKEELCTSFFTGEYPIDLLERKKEVSYDVPKE